MTLFRTYLEFSHCSQVYPFIYLFFLNKIYFVYLCKKYKYNVYIPFARAQQYNCK